MNFGIDEGLRYWVRYNRVFFLGYLPIRLEGLAHFERAGDEPDIKSNTD